MEPNQTNDMFYDNYKHICTRILERANMQMLVNPENPNQIYGYCCTEDVGGVTIIHYLYMKYPYRKMGLAKKLLLACVPEGPRVCTHIGRNWRTLREKFDLVYNPYLR